MSKRSPGILIKNSDVMDKFFLSLLNLYCGPKFFNRSTSFKPSVLLALNNSLREAANAYLNATELL